MSERHLTIVPGGASNSRPTASSCRAGIDTTRLRFRSTPDSYSAARGRQHSIHARGEARLCDLPDGVTGGVYPDGMGYVEGRVSALLGSVHEDDHRLATGAELLQAVDVAAQLVGCEAAESVGVGRLDLASELDFEDGREGLALLRMAASVDFPWLKASTEGSRRDALQTVFWRSLNGRSIALRLYDKGVEAGTHAPGERLRFERQRRYRKTREQTPEEAVGSDLGAAYVGRELAHLLLMSVDHSLVTPRGAIERLSMLLDQGAIAGREAQALAGFVVLEGRGLPDRTVRYRWAQLRRLGIALDSLDGDGRVLEFAAYVRRFAEPWRAAA